jgi:hypothetical protein
MKKSDSGNKFFNLLLREDHYDEIFTFIFFTIFKFGGAG